MTSQSHIYLGIGGWTFAPWRGEFYPKGLPHAKELSYASERLTSIEVNGTFYRTQTPKTFRAWAEQVPDEFGHAIQYKISFKTFTVDIIIKQHGAGKILLLHAIDQFKIIISIQDV